MSLSTGTTDVRPELGIFNTDTKVGIFNTDDTRSQLDVLLDVHGCTPGDWEGIVASSSSMNTEDV